MRRQVLVTERPNERWSIVLVFDAFSDGLGFRHLAIADGVRREGTALAAETSPPGLSVKRELTAVTAQKGRPKPIFSDSGAEPIGMAVLRRCHERRNDWHEIAREKQIQNAFAETINGRFRDELIFETLFSTPTGTKEKITTLREECNRNRPHSSFGNLMPRGFCNEIESRSHGSRWSQNNRRI